MWLYYVDNNLWFINYALLTYETSPNPHIDVNKGFLIHIVHIFSHFITVKLNILTHVRGAFIQTFKIQFQTPSLIHCTLGFISKSTFTFIFYVRRK